MIKKKITFNPFNIDSITDAIGELNLFQRQHDNRVELFLRKLAENGVEIAKERIQTYDAIFTADLLNHIHLEPKASGIYAVVSDSEHCAFVEFGTGQMGQEGSYPYPFPDGLTWEYNQGKTIFQISEGQYGWFYPALDGTWKFTQGMPARPYMYETAMELETVLKKVAREVFTNARY